MADDEQFSLCWNNFNSNLSAGFHESLCRGDLVDVTLAAEGQFVKAHRLVLSVCSPYFRKMFVQMPANQHAFVFLKDVSHSALKDLIQFMYCGEVNVKQEALPAFISTAEALQIKGLTDSDPAPAQSPAKPSTPAPQPAPPAQTITQAITPPRVRQRNSTSRSYRIETDDSDDKSTQIVLQATPVQQQTQQQQQTQPTIVQQTTTTTAIVSQKRTAPRSISTPHTKRVKNTIDPLEASEPTQITVQTVTESKSTSDAEFIDLPIEMPTKSEPDYSEETGEVETAEQDTTYVEDDSYGDMKYDESYFTEQEETGAATGGAGGATTSTAVVKQSFVDNSYVEQADQSANEAQGHETRKTSNTWRSKRSTRSKNKTPVCKTMMDKFKAALKLKPQNVVYASTTKGGMKVLFEGHYFKYVYKRYECGVFQCCYNENNEQCMSRIIVNRNQVYPLDGVHNHYNQATDKSVTSVLIEAGDAENEDDIFGDGTQLQTISQSLNLGESKEFVVMEVRESVDDANILPLQAIVLDENYPLSKKDDESDENHEARNEEINVLKKEADDLREKIKKRLQQALMKKKK